MKWRPQNARAKLLEKIMATYKLAAENQPEVPTFARGHSESVFDLAFVLTQVMQDIITWEVLEEESRSDHHYIPRAERK